MTADPEDLMFRSDDVTVEGTLWRPKTRAPYPALVMVHGSSAADRHNNGHFPPIREAFVMAGVAVFSYDKRGVGGSSGDWRSATLRDLAGDALAAVAAVRQRDDIISSQVGLFGHSQGGWIVPLAASLSPDIAFVITNSGPGIPVWEQVLFDMENQMRASGYSREQTEEAVASTSALLDAARQRAPQEQLRALHRELESRPWAVHLPVDEHGLRLDWDEWYGFDPAPVLERVTCPVLAIFGERDPFVPAVESAAVFAASLAHNRDLTIRIFPDADHRIRVRDGAAFAPGYLETLTSWVRGILDSVKASS